ncbi:hypothetical protein Mpal_2423 [Methanosphaerula palustris E1-9c]|uniref:Uncharacterized protein n=1 Tax=Methanosphaerula palustris (strain ATCC BAA-1556 / DSM 19958 / E1-9c) TaxID=521011 RepID=B8GEK1_METPE|nr:hypothetical protein Mpal_2423 [Methanosphaerula palustris E1-9c]
MSKNKGRETVPTKSTPAEKSVSPEKVESSVRSPATKKAHPAKHPHGRN